MIIYGLTFSISKGVPKGDTLIGMILACALAIFLVPLTGSQPGYLPELFASAYRYSGVAMSRELTTAGAAGASAGTAGAG